VVKGLDGQVEGGAGVDGARPAGVDGARPAGVDGAQVGVEGAGWKGMVVAEAANTMAGSGTAEETGDPGGGAEEDSGAQSSIMRKFLAQVNKIAEAGTEGER
jgi:hypothetical protein